MTNGNQLPNFDPGETIGDLLKRLGVQNDVFVLIAIDDAGIPYPAAGPNRNLQPIPDGTRNSGVFSTAEHACWFVYENSPARGRIRIGGTSWDG